MRGSSTANQTNAYHSIPLSCPSIEYAIRLVIAASRSRVRIDSPSTSLAGTNLVSLQAKLRLLRHTEKSSRVDRWLRDCMDVSKPDFGLRGHTCDARGLRREDE